MTKSTTTCTFNGCERPSRSKKLCSAHYMQYRRHGTLEALRQQSFGCDFKGCDNPHKANGHCAGHYAQAVRGATLTPLVDKRAHKPDYGRRRPQGEITARDEHGNKQCKACLDWLPESSFYARKSNTDGLTSRCKECIRPSNRRLRVRMYGLTPEGYTRMFEGQGSRCAACRTDSPGAPGWHIDHDHSCCPGQGSCGQCVRAILCRGCNLALGMVNDDTSRLRALAEYVEAYA